MSCADGSPMPSPEGRAPHDPPDTIGLLSDVNAAAARFVSKAHCCCGGFTAADLRAGGFGGCR